MKKDLFKTFAISYLESHLDGTIGSALDCLHFVSQKYLFNFRSLVHKLQLTAEEQEEYFTAIINSIFFEKWEFDFETNYENWLYQKAGESIEFSHLTHYILGLSEEKKVKLIIFLFSNYREGSYLIIRGLLLVQGRPYINDLLTHLKSKYYCIELLKRHKPSTLKECVEALEKEAKEQVNTIFQSLPKLVEAMIESPMSLALFFNNRQGEAVAKLQVEENKKLFSHFHKKKFTFDQYLRFFQYFGLSGRYPSTREKGFLFINNSISEIVYSLRLLFESPQLTLASPTLETGSFFAYVYRLTYMLASFIEEPDKFRAGSELITYVLPTRGKLLSRFSWLPSIAKGKQLLKSCFGNKNPPKPIYVIDQSEEGLFQQNSKYIKELYSETGIQVVHLSGKQIGRLAKKLGVERLVITAPDGSSGYGGARNAVYLLMPVVDEAFRLGAKNFDEVVAMDQTRLQEIFKERVLSQEASIVNMGDDDIEVPESNLACDALFANDFKKHYFNRPSICIGRVTHRLHYFFELEKIATFSEQVSYFVPWDSIPFSGGLKAIMGKPKFCLNLPFGNEESHAKFQLRYSDIFQLPSVHLSGLRFPSKRIPKNRLDGMADFLKSYIPYSFFTVMVQSFIDPGNHDGLCALPWNTEKRGEFNSLGEAFRYIGTEEVKRELQTRFWNNLGLTFDGKRDTILMNYIEILMLQKLELPESSSKRESAELLAVFQAFRKDAIAFYHAGKKLAAGEKFDEASLRVEVERSNGCKLEELPLTQGLFLICRVVGQGEFVDIARDIIPK